MMTMKSVIIAPRAGENVGFRPVARRAFRAVFAPVVYTVLFAWEFGRAAFEVVVLGKHREDDL